ncbi:MAG: hypothetical protein ACTSRG_08470 [Candidatus Helarchaeota archaeon]
MDNNKVNKDLEKNKEVWDAEKKGFKLSVRWSDKEQLYECYKEYFDTDKEEILFQSKELTEVLKRSLTLSNFYAEKTANEPERDAD